MAHYVYVRSYIEDNINIVELDNKLYCKRIKVDELKGYRESLDRNFDFKNVKYKNDEIAVTESTGTIAFVNRQYNVYGLIKENRRLGCLNITWVPFNGVDVAIDKLVGANDGLMDVTELGLDAFDSNWAHAQNGRFRESKCMRALNKPATINPLDFIVYIKEMQAAETEETEAESPKKTETTVKAPKKEIKAPKKEVTPVKEVKTEKVVEIAKVEKESTNEIIKDNVEKCESTSENMTNMLEYFQTNIENRLSELLKREEALAKREAELIEKSSKLNKILAKAEMLDVDNVIDTYIDVADIFCIDKKPVSNLTNNDTMYEMIIRCMNDGDRLTVPLEYFSKLKCLAKKTLTTNLAYTKYKAMVTLKFNADLVENAFCLIDYDEELRTVGIQILKKYDSETVTDNDLAKYMIKYENWRKTVASMV